MSEEGVMGTIALRFVGGAGQFLPGVPARDLTDEETERWPQARGSALYEALSRASAEPLPQGEFLPEPEEAEGE